MRRALLAVIVLLALLAMVAPHLSARADVVDADSLPAPVLSELMEGLDEAGVDVLYSQASEAGRNGPSYGDRPRLSPLVGFQAWGDVEVELDRYAEWLGAFESGSRGAVAAVPSDEPATYRAHAAFGEVWTDAGDGERIIITFDAADLGVAQRIARVLEASGYAVYLAIAAPDQETLDPEVLGRLFVKADHHFVIDTATARLNPVIPFESKLLIELTRQNAWLASDTPGLPPVTRGSLDVVEAIGVLPMSVLPGGIVLGMQPTLDPALAGAVLDVDGTDYGIRIGDERYGLDRVSKQTQEAIRAFVRTPDSHLVIDIAGSRVTLADPFQDTWIGDRMVKADRKPFDRLSIDVAQKSLIVDQQIRLRRDDGGRVRADVTLEVRFYQRDAEGYADRVASLGFTVEDVLGSARLLDLTWSRRPGTHVGFDGRAVDKLIDDLAPLALDAALIAIARL